VLALLIQSQLVLEVLVLPEQEQELTEVIPYSAPLPLREEAQVVIQIRVVLHLHHQGNQEVLAVEEVM
tara:strand:+ start:664 stop:867 length:204 start_codon:yes stop_codon:yes gene_type:complete